MSARLAFDSSFIEPSQVLERPEMHRSEFVVLADGPTVHVDAVMLALYLERRGCALQVDGDALLISRWEELAEGDRERIREWKAHLMTIATYEAPRCA